MTRISGSETSGQGPYAAIFEKSTKTNAWAANSGMTGPDFTTRHNDLHAQGYRLVWLDGFGVGATAYYNGIWEYTNGAAQRVRAGESLASHQSASASNDAAGFHLVDVSAFSVNGTALHAGIWAQGIGIATQVRYSLTSAQYQTEFNSMGGNGYYLWRVSGFESGTAERFTGVWRATSLGEGWAYHGMSAADFNSHNINAQYVGYRPVFIEAYNLGTDTFYNAVWIRNGGFPTSRLGTISTAMQNYIDTRSIPGLSLAIARDGRLVYARGFGYADTSDFEVAHAQHRWRIASTSKTVCAVSALRALEDSATWSLDSKAFGSGALFGTDYGTSAYSTAEKAITLRQLFNMTAGWNSQGKLWYNDEPSYGTNHTSIMYPSTRNGKTWWQHNGAMAGTQAILVVSDDGSQAFAYACNSVNSTDAFSGTISNTVRDLMDNIDNANAWPDIDLFGKYNPEYDAWAATAFGSSLVSRASLIDFWAPDSDPDGDGRSNALEAFLGSDPLVADGSPWTSVRLDAELVLRWTKKLGYRGVEAVPEWSSAMQTWSSASAQIVTRTDLITPVGSSIQEAQATIPRGVSRRYLRLSLTVP